MVSWEVKYVVGSKHINSLFHNELENGGFRGTSQTLARVASHGPRTTMSDHVPRRRHTSPQDRAGHAEPERQTPVYF